MATKNNPGQYDCYKNAAPDEPMFILLARDPMAPTLVRAWAHARIERGKDDAKAKDALTLADSMEAWALNKERAK